jgi:hypothetical protein
LESAKLKYALLAKTARSRAAGCYETEELSHEESRQEDLDFTRGLKPVIVHVFFGMAEAMP